MKRMLPAVLAAGIAVILGVSAPEAAARRDYEEVELEEARIYWEYNSSGNDLGVHVFLDGEDWVKMKITNPEGRTIFRVEGKGPYELGLTELFFEGAEPSLDDFPLEDLLELFPPGEYEFEGTTADGCEIEGVADFSHAIPEGPAISANLNGSSLVISWSDVTDHPDGFPDEEVDVVAYQVIVGSFQVTVPAGVNQVTVSPEYVASLESGQHDYEVLAIDASNNQSITEGTFTKP